MIDNRSTLGAPEGRTDGAESCERYHVAALIADVSIRLGLPVGAECDVEKAMLSAAGLLMALGVKPVLDDDDQRPAAHTIRELLLEDSTRTTTRSRRSL